MLAPAVAVLALLAAAAAPLELPPLPGPEAGHAALWAWLRAANAALTIPDAGFRRMFGGISIPVLLLLEGAGVRRDWKLYPFLVPFWLVFGGIALGAVAGVALTAAHVVLFPVGRIWFMLRDRERTREAKASSPAPGAPPPMVAVRESDRAGPGAPLPTRPAAGPLHAALEAIRAATEQARAARPAAGNPAQARAQARAAIMRALGVALGEAGARAPTRAPGRPPPLTPARRDEATGAPPGSPDLSRFRPDLSRFRRPPHRG